jgi:GNAT superfamily N-acetyltransferase
MQNTKQTVLFHAVARYARLHSRFCPAGAIRVELAAAEPLLILSRLTMQIENQPNFHISTDKNLLDVGVIDKFLSEESYWANRRTREQTEKAIENSICFGLYDGEKQIGFARVVSDRATFAYLGDVFVLKEYRGRGLSKMLMEAVVSHPDLQGLRRWLLATKDAHGLYEQFDFKLLRLPERWMERTAPDAYLP